MSSSVQVQPYTSHADKSDGGTPARPIRTRTQVKTPGMVAQSPDSRHRITIPNELIEKTNKKQKASAHDSVETKSDASASSVVVQPKRKKKTTSSKPKHKAVTDAPIHDDEVKGRLRGQRRTIQPVS
ncbi:uncharacterized protein MELLADRAFT_105394 [Melampsora larici-populina 98AG31]|uniref:Uncharacterized protein n=1 Tax=Melampsora larici-populina (strain 98AG31 / pathotype 3-4-7) TaxID=747676 RepID=F4RI00_MELLP|nr:uncharacterized protein MELLADRAFT_105394 [Melampsora larici-populina 98AG31]EGG08041.1 hypothetical protein MELLADRAFT_105394 [Melampsora larici-populina 98AG31]